MLEIKVILQGTRIVYTKVKKPLFTDTHPEGISRNAYVYLSPILWVKVMI